MTQRGLASALGVAHSTIGRIELGERRVDIVELHTIFSVLGADADAEFLFLARQFSENE